MNIIPNSRGITKLLFFYGQSLHSLKDLIIFSFEGVNFLSHGSLFLLNLIYCSSSIGASSVPLSRNQLDLLETRRNEMSFFSC